MMLKTRDSDKGGGSGKRSAFSIFSGIPELVRVCVGVLCIVNFAKGSSTRPDHKMEMEHKMELVGFPNGHYVFERDPRVMEWVSAQPWTLVSIIASYLYMVYIWGPKFMRDRKPYELTTVTRVYNVFQVVASLGFAIRIWTLFYVTMGNSLLCTPPDRRTDPLAKLFMHTVYYYWWLRVIDFADTLFFVLRKRQRQITFLHVFHHVIVVAAAWGSAYFGLTNLLIFTLCLNSVVHSIMYTYYFLSTLGPAVQPYLWWKRHLTKLQIVQFFIMMGHLSVPMWRNCGYPPSIVYFWMGAVGAIMLLFVNFYIRSYRQQQKRLETATLANGESSVTGAAAAAAAANGERPSSWDSKKVA